MHLSFLPLITLFTLIWTASQSLASRTVFPVGNGGAVVNDASGNARVFYQATDGSIHMLSGSGVTNGRNYADSLIIASGVAKSGSPIAAVAPGNDLSKTHVIVIGSDNYLKEFIYNAATGKWDSGSLTAANFGNYPNSKYLWAYYDNSGIYKVGFVKTENILTEGYTTTVGGTWTNVDF